MTNSLQSLGSTWQLAFDEAWQSFRDGNFGIGAVLVDPTDNSVVSVGRNRVAQRSAQERMLTGNMTAHAEMNAFASLDRFNADGLHLYTTLEPCLMCAATAMQLKLSAVHFAAADEFYVGMDDLWTKHPITAQRCPTSFGPLHGGLARFARLLPMVFTLRHFPGRTAEIQARQAHPDLARVVDGLQADARFQEITASGTVNEAIDYLDL